MENTQGPHNKIENFTLAYPKNLLRTDFATHGFKVHHNKTKSAVNLLIVQLVAISLLLDLCKTIIPPLKIPKYINGKEALSSYNLWVDTYIPPTNKKSKIFH